MRTGWVFWCLLSAALLLTGSTAAARQAAFKQSPPAAYLDAPMPVGGGPVVINARFDLHSINQIHDEAETFDFSGVLTLVWKDPRQAFDPAAEGVREKVYQGAYQFNEVSPGWYPQVVLVNETGGVASNGVLLRVQPDGTSTLVQTISATAKVQLIMHRYPLDQHRLEAVFEVLGFDNTVAEFQVTPGSSVALDTQRRIPEWSISDIRLESRTRTAEYAWPGRTTSTLVLSLLARRDVFYVARLIVIPLAIIVLLSFAVFWMDRSSVGDRISVSFIGILTGVAYQIVMSDHMPRIAYPTLMHSFLNVSFLTMCATVVINLLVAGMDKSQRFAAGDLIDRRCRVIFPVAYLGLLGLIVTIALVFY